MIKHILIVLFVFLFCKESFSQADTLYTLSGNNVIHNYYIKNKNNPNAIYNSNAYSSKKAALTLPFLDDFSQNWIYPNQTLWEDYNVYVNSSFAIIPTTYGVATFDGLDFKGAPYNFIFPTAYGAADTLTSKTIDVETITDSVYLSFYYQPQGNGNKPEAKDSLSLEFFRLSDSSWVRMWGVPGEANHPFKQVMLALDTSFQHNSFQFRFINWATLSGNEDHWNIDYVYLNDNRTHADTTINDVSFITNHHNLLNEFTAMPWNHYLTDSVGFMKSFFEITHTNNSNTSRDVEYKIQVIDNNGAGPITGNPYPFAPSNQNVGAHNQSSINLEIAQFPHDYNFPSETADSKVFQIINYFKLIGLPDDYEKNDTVLSYQVFHDYYAYDDGSAELGYGVQGIGSKLAHEFDIKKSDTLTAIQIYFNPIRDDLSAENFRLKVWSSLSPEVEVYSQSNTQFYNPIYSPRNEFVNYTLNQPIYLSAGTYYFGWEKISNNFLNVGYDVNTSNKTKVHYNAVGVWQTPSNNIPDGSLMIRPIFRNLPPNVVSVDELKITPNNFVVYPNPTSNFIYFKTNNANINNYTVQLIDVYGKLIIETTSNHSNKINVSNIANGVYMVKFLNKDTLQSEVKKIIIAN